jgi:hypothetical protein
MLGESLNSFSTGNVGDLPDISVANFVKEVAELVEKFKITNIIMIASDVNLSQESTEWPETATTSGIVKGFVPLLVDFYADLGGKIRDKALEDANRE